MINIQLNQNKDVLKKNKNLFVNTKVFTKFEVINTQINKLKNKYHEQNRQF